MRGIQRLIVGHEGQDLAEYALLLMLIAAVVIVAISPLAIAISDGYHSYRESSVVVEGGGPGDLPFPGHPGLQTRPPKPTRE